MTEAGCKNLYGICSFSVTTLVATILAAAPAIADTVEQFQARCLTPMIEVRETDISGLTRVPHRAAWETWRIEGADWELQRALPGAVVQYCSVHGWFGAEVSDWADAMVASGDWVEIDRIRRTLRSTFLREPLIELEIVHHRTRPTLTVIETNLES